VSFKDEKIPIESQLMLDYANGLPFRDCLEKYRDYLIQYLSDHTLLQDDCNCIYALITQGERP
jgi:hypothetical protein